MYSFSGHMLIAWLCSTFDEDHYLFYTISKSDAKVMATQFCTHLLAAGVIKRLDGDLDPTNIFKVSKNLCQILID